jgi:alanine racemase
MSEAERGTMSTARNQTIVEAPDQGDLQLSRPNRFEVDLDAIAHNAAAVRRLAGTKTRIFAALKGDAYGYGAVAVAQAVLSAGVDAISLVNVADAVKLRRHGVSAPVLLYAGVPPDENVVAAVERYDFMPTVLDLDSARVFSSRSTRDLNVFVKIDVGLERLGVAPDDVVDFVAAVAALPRLNIHGVYAHMHVPRNEGVTPYMAWQFGRFEGVLARLRGAGVRIPIAMTASTSVLLASATTMNLNAIDPGLVFFGLDRHGPGLSGAGLRSAFHALTSRLVQVKMVTRTEFRGVAPFSITAPMRLGVIPIGRYDGMEALCCGHVLVRGVRAEILGAPTTEHTRIDLTHLPEARVGDEVVVIGRQGGDEISPAEVAQHRGLSSPGMVALGIRDSVPRVYRGAGGEMTRDRG